MFEEFSLIVSNFIAVIETFIPRLVFAGITLIVGICVGKIIGFVVNKIVGRMGCETVFRKTSVGRAIMRSGYTPEGFFSVLSRALVYIFASILALDQLSITFLTGMIQSFFDYMPMLLESVFILVFGFIFSDWIGELVEKGSFFSNKTRLISAVTKVLLYFFSITMALSQMKVDVTVLYIFAQAFAWSLAIAFGLAIGWHLKDNIKEWMKEILPDERARKGDAD